MRKTLAIIGLTAGLAGGGVAGMAFTGAAGAQTDTTTTTTADQPASGNTADRPDPGARFTEALAGLVTDGTITQDQSDKVVEALEAAGPPDGGHGHGGGHGREGRGGPGSEAAATALGLSADELRTELQSGSTIADVAKEKNVDLQKVIDAMVKAEEEHLAAEVASGRHTQAEADERLATATERITARVNGEAPEGGMGGPGGQPPVDAPADATTTTAA